jgi:hypothetical protein
MVHFYVHARLAGGSRIAYDHRDLLLEGVEDAPVQSSWLTSVDKDKRE